MILLVAPATTTTARCCVMNRDPACHEKIPFRDGRFPGRQSRTHLDVGGPHCPAERSGNCYTRRENPGQAPENRLRKILDPRRRTYEKPSNVKLTHARRFPQQKSQDVNSGTREQARGSNTMRKLTLYIAACARSCSDLVL